MDVPTMLDRAQELASKAPQCSQAYALVAIGRLLDDHLMMHKGALLARIAEDDAAHARRADCTGGGWSCRC